jgi:hypothetical protein
MDKKVTPIMMEILEIERANKHELITELNSLLSISHIILNKPEMNRGRFLDGKLREFYLKYQRFITHCFNVKGLP